MIQGDIGWAIAASLTKQEFFQTMRKMGCTITPPRNHLLTAEAHEAAAL